MAESDNILTKLQDLLLYLIPQLNKFPRDQKFVLGDRIENKLLDGFKVMVGELDPEWAFPLQFHADGQGGKFALSLPSQSNHSGYQMQIEKDGYLPGASAEMQRTNGTQTLEFALHKGTGPSGVVLQPDGGPEATARLSERRVRIDYRSLDQRCAAFARPKVWPQCNEKQ